VRAFELLDDARRAGTANIFGTTRLFRRDLVPVCSNSGSSRERRFDAFNDGVAADRWRRRN